MFHWYKLVESISHDVILAVADMLQMPQNPVESYWNDSVYSSEPKAIFIHLKVSNGNPKNKR